MSDGKRSFWSSVPGLITGLAGLLTGIVGLTTLLIQQGIVGHKGGTTATTTPAPASPTSPTSPAGVTTTIGGLPGTTAPAGSFVVNPTSIDFQPADPNVKTLTLTNTSPATPLTVLQPTVGGDNMDRFSAAYATCTSAPLPPGSSCTLKVTFTPAPGTALKHYSASLQVAAIGAPSGYYIGLTATTLL